MLLVVLFDYLFDQVDLSDVLFVVVLIKFDEQCF